MRFRTKITASLLLAGIVPLAIVGYFGIDLLRKNALDAAISGVEMNGTAKTDSVKSYFDEQIKWMTTVAQSPMTAEAIQDLSNSARELTASGAVEGDEAQLRSFLAGRHARTADTDSAALERWVNDLDQEAQVLDQVYILDNPNPEGKKQAADFLEAGGSYSVAHRRFHPYYHDLLNRFGYYDIFMIEPDEGRIVYSVMKEPDFGTSLSEGPYRSSDFAVQAERMIESKGAGGPVFVDFAAYEPSYNTAAAFMLVPVGEGSTFSGILAFQMPLEFVQAVVRKNFSQTAAEVRSYILGADHTLRTIPDDESQAAVGDRLDSALVEAISASDADIFTAQNEHGTEVIASVKQIELPGTVWTLVSEANRAETMAAADAAEQTAIYSTVIIAAIIAVLGLVIAHVLLRPIVKLGQSLKAEADSSSAAMRQAAKAASNAVQAVAAIAEETSAQAETVRDSSSVASSNVQEMSAAVDQLTASITDVARGVKETADLMNDASAKTQEAERYLADLERVADRIGGMVDLINDVANRTNLLALNAAVEAAHAGDAGRGFAVVASEIRKLAGRTTESTEIIGSEVRQVLEAVHANGTSIRGISVSVAKVTEMSRSLSVASSQQETVTDEMARRMTDTATRVADVDHNIETVKTAAGTSAQAATDLVAQLSVVEKAGSDISNAVDRMAERILRI